VDGTGSKLAVARGLDWIQGDMAGRAGRAVVNMSMFFDAATGNEATQLCENGSGGMVNCVSALENEVSQIVAQNIVFVTSANNQGNGNCTTVPARMGYGGTYSATYRPITVGATTYTNTNGTYTDSRWAGANPSNYGTCVSIWAPGSRLRIATTRGTSDYYQQNAGGTSYASAITSGVVARLLQWYPSWSAQQVWNELVSRANSRYTATDFDPSAHTNTKLVYISHTE
jgi:hypothetical protein